MQREMKKKKAEKGETRVALESEREASQWCVMTSSEWDE